MRLKKMNRRQALLSCGLLLPFFQTKDWNSIQLSQFESNYTISFAPKEGILTITSKTRNVKVSIDEIMDALESK